MKYAQTMHKKGDEAKRAKSERRKNSMTHQVQQKQVQFHPSEAQLLDSVLKNYLEYLQCTVPLSKEQTKMLNILRAFLLRLKSVSQGHVEGAQLWLTDLELRTIEKALLTFCQQVPWFAGPSHKRDEIVQALEKIRERIRGLLPPPCNEEVHPPSCTIGNERPEGQAKQHT